jgi:hypothetical protein
VRIFGEDMSCVCTTVSLKYWLAVLAAVLTSRIGNATRGRRLVA